MNGKIIVFLVAIAVLDSVTANKDHNNLCRDLTDFGDLTYINETVQVCTSTLEKKCAPITVKECLDVTEMLCEVELFTDCAMDWTTHNLTESRPTTLNKTLSTCEKIFKVEQHEKIHYECKNVTKQHCTSLWKVVNGEKVWAGNDDDCKDVTWEECKPQTVTVDWEVPYMNCTPVSYPYLSYENITIPKMADTMDCEVKKRSVCKPKKTPKCAEITYTTCKEEPVQDCRPVSVPCPHKEKIHKQWCLFDQGVTGAPANAVDDQPKKGRRNGKSTDQFQWILTEINSGKN